MPYIHDQSHTFSQPLAQHLMSQSMLFTRRLTTFLSQNTTPQLPTLILLSPTGKLLSSSSPLPASTLRTQATLACSLWTTYQASAPSLISASHPQAPSRDQSRSSDITLSSTSTAAENELASIAIQFTHGTMVIQGLNCGLLFIAIGPTPYSSSPRSSSHTLHMQALSANTSPPSSPQPHGEAHELGLGLNENSTVLSDAGSVLSTGTRTGTGNIMGMKRQAGEVARWLDSQLNGFSLSSGVER